MRLETGQGCILPNIRGLGVDNTYRGDWPYQSSSNSVKTEAITQVHQGKQKHLQNNKNKLRTKPNRKIKRVGQNAPPSLRFV